MGALVETAIVNSMSATSALMVLGEYLSHISSIRDKIASNIREEARIGADVIAASSQYSIAAVESLSGEDTPSIPLPVFALTRSAIYGLLYLDNADLVRKKERLPSPGKFIQQTMYKWSKGNTFGLGKFDESKDYHDLWSKLSEFVHIIPAIHKGGGAKYSGVNFDFGRDLSKPTKHAGLPEHFDELASECLEWQSLLTLATIAQFRRSHKHFFEFSSTKVQNHLESRVFPDCIQAIQGISSSDQTSKSISRLAKTVFSSSH